MKQYTIKQISEWQKEVSGEQSKISLPSMQRGFVWKPNQIENLWDSILRGYPIGSILMSKDENDNRELLDGQQRCTSVALGFFDPFDETQPKEILNLKSYLPSIWIDLKPIKLNDERKFIVKVLTKSHPWGFQTARQNTGNHQTLSMSDRRKAKEVFFKFQHLADDKSYLELLPKYIFPWDAYCPIPLSWLLDTNEKTIENLLLKIKNLKVITKYSNGDEVDYSSLTIDDLTPFLQAIENANSLFVPEIIVKTELLKNETENENQNNQSESQNPTLFVRLNAGGTTLNGEELMYSVFKSIFPEAKELVEKIGASYIAPSKIISLFSRVINAKLNGFTNFPRNFNANTFKIEVSKNDSFVNELIQLIETDNSEFSKAEKIFTNAINIIAQGKNISPIFIKNIITSNFELFLVLLIYIEKNKLENIDNNLKKEISSNYIYMLWFARDKKTTSTLYKYLFTDEFSWKVSAQNLIHDNLLFPLITPTVIKKYFDQSFEVVQNYNENREILKNDTLRYSKDLTDEQVIENWHGFIEKIRWNKSLLLYSQNQYLSEKFKEFNQFENLEDTNRPYDWDHIYPISWVYNKDNIHLLVKNWVNTIGNFRALSYDDNRRENNNYSPKERLPKEENQIDLFKNDPNYFNDVEYWEKLDIRRIKKDNTESVKIFLYAVSYRMLNIYKFWYDDYFKS
jgi:hypothetical protein